MKLFILLSPFLQEWKRFHKNTGCQNLIIVRHGGIGDLLVISSLAAKIKNISPETNISLLTQSKYHLLFNGLSYFDELLSYTPRSIIKIIKSDSILLFDNIIESDIEAKSINIYDLISKKYSGITLDNTEKKPIINIDETCISYLLRSIPSLSKNIKKLEYSYFLEVPCAHQV